MTKTESEIEKLQNMSDQIEHMNGELINLSDSALRLSAQIGAMNEILYELAKEIQSEEEAEEKFEKI